MLELNLDNLEDLARGTAFLATGGGGDPYIGKLMLKHQLELGKTVKIISPDEIDDDTFANNDNCFCFIFYTNFFNEI